MKKQCIMSSSEIWRLQFTSEFFLTSSLYKFNSNWLYFQWKCSCGFYVEIALCCHISDCISLTKLKALFTHNLPLASRRMSNPAWNHHMFIMESIKNTRHVHCKRQDIFLIYCFKTNTKFCERRSQTIQFFVHNTLFFKTSRMSNKQFILRG